MTQRIQIPLVIRIDGERPRTLGGPGFLGLNQDREIRETRVVEESSKRLTADEPLADVFVSIDSAAAGLFRIVAMKDLEPIESDQSFE